MRTELTGRDAASEDASKARIRRCYVLGAGFSNAVAGLPAMRGLWASLDQIHAKERARDRTSNRAGWGIEIQWFMTELKDRFFKPPYLEEGESFDSLEGLDLEKILSFIDLHLASPVRAVVRHADGTMSDRNLGSLFPWPGSLREVPRHVWKPTYTSS